MYSFERHGDHLTVRPEGTAGCTRAYVQNAVAGREAVSRWYYLGPMFRAERPAKGRYRQFHQGGCEIYGDPGPLCDAELIALCAEFIQALGIDAFQIHVNSLGSSGVRERYREALVHHFEPLAASLSEDSQRRLKTNPLRILDSKAPQDREAIDGAPSVVDLLDGEDAAHFERLQRYLDALEVPYVVDPKLVRGLDYYTRTLFELKETSGALGSQDALLGGGRYDGMVTRLGGKKPVPAIGFAMGIERILTLVEDDEPRPAPDCYLAPMTEPAREQALVLAKQLRRLGRYCEVDGRGLSVKAMLRRANTLGSTLALLIGEGELSRGVVTVKNLAAHEQDEVAVDQAAEVLAARLAGLGEADGGS
ncbi:MAG: histidine--tRNA ligase [Deltaproteobacteria bacterium]|nr:histidine--tRNA ligase [Deltaproteobacteria bacterium]